MLSFISWLAAKPGVAWARGGRSETWPPIHSVSSPALLPPVTGLGGKSGGVWGVLCFPAPALLNFSSWIFDQTL